MSKIAKNRECHQIIWKITAFLICAVCLAFLIYDVTVGSYCMRIFDDVIFGILRSGESRFSTVFFRLMTNMVNPVVILLISFSMIHYLKQKRYLISMIANVGITVFLNMSTKGIVMRMRPPLERRLITEAGYSFPSGHSMVAASFYGFLIYMIFQTTLSEKRKYKGAILCAVIALLVGCSRVYLGVHYATDVLAGFIVSAMYLILYTAVVKKYLSMDSIAPGRNPLAKHRLFMSFKYAFEGIMAGLENEKNMMIHYSALVMVVVFGLTLQISKTEWMICLILCGLVIALEQMNTALEAVVDLVTKDKQPLAKLAKDAAAGAVLVIAITAAVVGLIIFMPKLFYLLNVNL